MVTSATRTGRSPPIAIFSIMAGSRKASGSPRGVFRQASTPRKAWAILDGLVFRPESFNDKPAGMSDERFPHRSVGRHGLRAHHGARPRPRPGARSRPQMVRTVAFLNAKNAMYKTGPRHFTSSIIEDNCVHLPHNALAACDVMSCLADQRFHPVRSLRLPSAEERFRQCHAPDQ